MQKAADLQPDLVILDIGLPKMNGIEVARQILSISPESRIVFLTEDSSWEVVEAALNSGGDGYLIKSASTREFIPAVEAVLEVEKFLRLEGMEPQTALESRSLHYVCT